MAHRRKSTKKKNLYVAAGKSPFRTKLSNLAKPSNNDLMGVMLESIERKTMEKAGQVYEIYSGGRRYVRMPVLSFSQRADIFQRVLNGGQRALPFAPSLFGPLIGQKKIERTIVYMAALCARDPRQTQNSFIASPTQDQDGNAEKNIILDMARILEQAVSRINFFRYCELEQPEARWLLSREEQKRPNQGIIRRRLECILTREEYTPDHFTRSIADLGKLCESPNKAFNLWTLFRFLGIPVHLSWSEDIIQHTINLCNLIASSSLISAMATDAAKEKAKDFISKDFAGSEARMNMLLITHITGLMAQLAYGSPFLRLGDSEKNMHLDENDINEQFFRELALKSVYIRLARAMHGLKEHEDPPENYNELIMVSLIKADEDDWREAAKEVLRHSNAETLEKETGQAYYSFALPKETVELLEMIQKEEFFTRENLPEILQVWNEFYFKD